ncbi:FHA domain-containing protein [Acetivibrio mesophilus]|uniref:FHA domain-containing protein n=1 Tax=Acetivibrio mesophilus TaxID=2487273 RepID=A0A4Q0I441_9FIRM|nr:FHA domain-containing protein [Acetivibrio mesophilus]ODM27828.1 FHA domain-containing protein [Clostridium sp. Bc-iso-3]RXE59028.1 FHA domain-containing protein [Acetivibrio mesophilus]HHV30105.1 FHA domain-containing protein [Clostridium sp.]
MFEIILLLVKVVFTLVIYLFIFGVIRLIYLDIKSMSISKTDNVGFYPYLKLINQREMLDFKVEENYTLRKSVIIGRNDKNDIVIKDPFISGIHAYIMAEGESVRIKDMGSKNGTFVNGVRLNEGEIIPLKDGDNIKIGHVKFLFVSIGK